VAIYVKNNNDFEQTEPIVRECPHCGVHAPMVPIATPGFAALKETRPHHTGVAFRCAACNEPRFARAAVRSFGDDRIILSANLVEVERPKEHFQYNYMPKETGRLLREAFGCYAADLTLAFAVLCRHTIASAMRAEPTVSEATFEHLFEDTCRLAEIDHDTRQVLHSALFMNSATPAIDADQAAMLIEIVKDMFHQRFVRTSKLRRAIQMRRFFASESDQKSTGKASPSPSPLASSSEG
jgi:hypothetical protein